MSCYFPVRFTPPKGDPHGVTRQQVNGGHLGRYLWGGGYGCAQELAEWMSCYFPVR